MLYTVHHSLILEVEDMKDNPDLTVAGLAKFASCHRNTVVSYCNRGLITAYRDVNNYRRFSKAEALKLKKLLNHRRPDPVAKNQVAGGGR